DGGFILGGISYSGISGDKTQANFGAASTSDYWMLKIDSLGIKQWDKTFGGIQREDEYGNLFQTSDGGFMLAGTSYSDSTGNKSEANLGPEQTWVIKTDDLGNKQWDKTIFTPGHDEAGMAVQTNGSGFAFANC